MKTCETCKANKVCDHNRFGFENCGNYISADVVPKSEAEELKAIIADHKANEERMEELYSNIKAEVAREIFAEIEFDIHQLMFERDETRAIAIEGVIANLKKQYTEENK